MTMKDPQMPAPDQYPWLTLDETADRFRVSRRTVEHMIARGDLVAYKATGTRRVLINRDEADAFIRSCPTRVADETGRLQKKRHSVPRKPRRKPKPPEPRPPRPMGYVDLDADDAGERVS